MKQNYPYKTLKPVNTTVTNDAYSYNIYPAAITFYMDKPLIPHDPVLDYSNTITNSSYTYYINNTYAITDTYYYNHQHSIDYLYLPGCSFEGNRAGASYNKYHIMVDTGLYSNYSNRTYAMTCCYVEYVHYTRFLYPEDIAWNGTFRYSLIWMIVPIDYDLAGYHIDQIVADTDTIILSGHGFVENAVVLFPPVSTSWGSSCPMSTGTTFYAVNTGTNSFQVSLSTGGTPVNILNNFVRGTNGYMMVNYARVSFVARASINDVLPTTAWSSVDDEATKFYEMKYTPISLPVSITNFNKSKDEQICLLQVASNSGTAWSTTATNVYICGIILFP